MCFPETEKSTSRMFRVLGVLSDAAEKKKAIYFVNTQVIKYMSES